MASDNDANLASVAQLASKISSPQHLRKIILDAKPELRRQVYKLITPYITAFIPPSFKQLMNPPGPRMRSPKNPGDRDEEASHVA